MQFNYQSRLDKICRHDNVNSIGQKIDICSSVEGRRCGGKSLQSTAEQLFVGGIAAKVAFTPEFHLSVFSW